jgi:hypothetical protein
MITNDNDLKQAIEQQDRMYRALAEIRARLGSVKSPQFQLMAEGPIDEIRRLRREIDAYLGVSASDPVSV